MYCVAPARERIDGGQGMRVMPSRNANYRRSQGDTLVWGRPPARPTLQQHGGPAQASVASDSVLLCAALLSLFPLIGCR